MLNLLSRFVPTARPLSRSPDARPSRSCNGSPLPLARRCASSPTWDAIEALAAEGESLWRRLSAADFLSEDEKRAAVGYGRRDSGVDR